MPGLFWRRTGRRASSTSSLWTWLRRGTTLTERVHTDSEHHHDRNERPQDERLQSLETHYRDSSNSLAERHFNVGLAKRALSIGALAAMSVNS